MKKLLDHIFKAAKEFGCDVTNIISADDNHVTVTCNYGGTPFVVKHTKDTYASDVYLTIQESYNNAVRMLSAEARR